MKTYRQFISQKDLDIKNVIIRLLYGWKIAFLVIIICCILLGIYQNKKNINLLEQQNIMNEDLLRKIHNLIDARKEYAILDEYDKNSIFMTINPYSVYKGSIHITGCSLVEIIQPEELYEKISTDIFNFSESKYIQEIFSLTSTSEESWEISFVCPDQELCEKILSYLEDFIGDQKNTKTLAEREIALWGQQEELISPDIFDKQTEFRNLQSNYSAQISNWEAELSESQYQYMLQLEQDKNAKYKPISTSVKLNWRKIIIFGCFGGIIIYVICMVVWVVISERINSQWEIEEITGIPVLTYCITKSPKLWLSRKILALHLKLIKKDSMSQIELSELFVKAENQTVAIVECGIKTSESSSEAICTEFGLEKIDFEESHNVIIIIQARKTTYAQLYKTLQHLSLLSKKTIGFVVFEH